MALPFARYHTSVAIHTALLVTVPGPAMCHNTRCNNDAGETLALPHAIFRFDMFHVLGLPGGNWDPTDKKSRLVRAKTC